MPVRIGNNELLTILNGVPTSLGVIIATTTKNNHDTATPFNNTGDALCGKVLMVQSDVDCYIQVGTANTVTATASATSASIKLKADERIVFVMGSTQGWIAAIPSTAATANVKVWELL